MNNRTEFIVAAIKDTQATIRAIDVKVAALLVVILAPFASISRIFAHIQHISDQSPRWIYIFLVVTFLAAWAFALISLVRAIGAIDNPSKHLINTNSVTGSFYAGGLYEFGVLDVFLNRSVIKASTDPQNFAEKIPTTVAEIESELVFEQMKLAYIRDVKVHRLNWGLQFSSVWFGLGIGIFLASKYLL
jgi:hypothetical protein